MIVGSRRSDADSIPSPASRTGASATVSQQAIVQKLLPKLRAIAGIQASASNPASLGVRGFGKPLQFVIQSSASYEELNGIANTLVEKLKDNPGLADLDTDLRLNKPEVRDRDRPRRGPPTWALTCR